MSSHSLPMFFLIVLSAVISSIRPVQCGLSLPSNDLASLLSAGDIRLIGVFSKTRLMALFFDTVNGSSALSVYDLPTANELRNYSLNLYGVDPVAVSQKWPSMASKEPFQQLVAADKFKGALAMDATFAFITRIEVPSTYEVQALICSAQSVTVHNYSASYFPAPLNSSFISSAESSTFYILEQGTPNSPETYYLHKYTVADDTFTSGTRLQMCMHDAASNQIVFQSNASMPCGSISWRFHKSAYTDGTHFRLFDQSQVYVFEQAAVDRPGKPASVEMVPYAKFVVHIAPPTTTIAQPTTNRFANKIPLMIIIIVILVVIILVSICAWYLCSYRRKNIPPAAQTYSQAETTEGTVDPYLKFTQIKGDYYLMTKTRAKKSSSKRKRKHRKGSKRSHSTKGAGASSSAAASSSAPGDSSSAAPDPKSRNSRATVQANAAVQRYMQRMKARETSNSKSKGKTARMKDKSISANKKKNRVADGSSSANSKSASSRRVNKKVTPGAIVDSRASTSTSQSKPKKKSKSKRISKRRVDKSSSKSGSSSASVSNTKNKKTKKSSKRINKKSSKGASASASKASKASKSRSASHNSSSAN